jgi:hypothetical protein
MFPMHFIYMASYYHIILSTILRILFMNSVGVLSHPCKHMYMYNSLRMPLSSKCVGEYGRQTDKFIMYFQK